MSYVDHRGRGSDILEHKEWSAEALLAENVALKAAIDDMRARIGELERLADGDTLTPLPNRRVFVREVERATAAFARHGSPAAVMFIDVDSLKGINDRWGHHAGDAALLHVARVLRRELRTGDIVARIGGDEFGLLLDRLDEPAARAKGEALLATVAIEPLELGTIRLYIGLSLGLAMIGAGDTVDAVLARADTQMYAAKAQRSAR